MARKMSPPNRRPIHRSAPPQRRSGANAPFQVAIIASGQAYQEAAAWAAATYVRQIQPPGAVSVLLPRREPLVRRLRLHARRFGFVLDRFPLRRVSEAKFTSQLKCQAFWHAVSRLRDGQLVLLADADTCCLQPLCLAPEAQAGILGGKIGLAPDIVDRHFRSPADPWYLPPAQRAVYVNSGVIVAGRKSLPLFTTFRRLSKQKRFLHGPFNDQKVINYALGRRFRERLVLLDRAFNELRQFHDPRTVIAHCAGGAGNLGHHPAGRQTLHQQLCAAVLQRTRRAP